LFFGPHKEVSLKRSGATPFDPGSENNLASSAMDRSAAQKQLEQVEQKLREEMDQVTRQRELLTKLASQGVEIESAKMLLGRLEACCSPIYNSAKDCAMS
jgi:(p)ppGpp synthase/HD superfamily hydrolase